MSTSCRRSPCIATISGNTPLFATGRSIRFHVDDADGFEKSKILVHILDAHRLIFGTNKISDLGHAVLAIGDVEGFIQHVVTILCQRNLLLEVLVSRLLDQPPTTVFGPEKIHGATNLRISYRNLNSKFLVGRRGRRFRIGNTRTAGGGDTVSGRSTAGSYISMTAAAIPLPAAPT